MGNTLPKPVTSLAVKRFGGASFRVGLAEMNGWRLSMEDAHVVLMQASWGFFGVFDGHGGSQCSKFVARRFVEELRRSDRPPEDDRALKALALKIDAQFLDTGQSSGSTATFALVSPREGGRYGLRVGNIGDSRVLLGRRDGSMFEGAGTDGALTTDHKPDSPLERARIERNGGTVAEGLGGASARVNGDLAVSRAFGDRVYKETGGPSQEERPVTADPELLSLECDASDFLVLVCDGISERSFPNREVVRSAAERLSGGEVDPGAAAAAVCKKALDMGSRDNLSCMIVLLGGGDLAGEEDEFIPGPVDALGEKVFWNAYAGFAEHAGRSMAEAVELRYRALQRMRHLDQDEAAELKDFGGGPPEAASAEERKAWFQAWVDRMRPPEPGSAAPRAQAQSLPPPALPAGDAGDVSPVGDGMETRRLQKLGPVRVVHGDLLKPAVEAHSTMEWQDGLLSLAGRTGIIIDVDEEADLAQVKFACGREWLPTTVLLSQ